MRFPMPLRATGRSPLCYSQPITSPRSRPGSAPLYLPMCTSGRRVQVVDRFHCHCAPPLIGRLFVINSCRRGMHRCLCRCAPRCRCRIAPPGGHLFVIISPNCGRSREMHRCLCRSLLRCRVRMRRVSRGLCFCESSGSMRVIRSRGCNDRVVCRCLCRCALLSGADGKCVDASADASADARRRASRPGDRALPLCADWRPPPCHSHSIPRPRQDGVVASVAARRREAHSRRSCPGTRQRSRRGPLSLPLRTAGRFAPAHQRRRTARAPPI